MEKGFIAYFKDFSTYMRAPTTKKTEAELGKEENTVDRGARAMSQYYESEELIKRMKWKRVTWEDGADYPSFSKRILDNDEMFKHTKAFSFMSIYVVKDPSTTEVVNLPASTKTIEAGVITRWFTQERDPQAVALYPVHAALERRSGFTVDWSSGNVRILDTASAQEILIFLSTVAPRLQALQVRMEEQQTRQTTTVENIRVRVGAVVKFNEHDTSFWDDPKRKTDSNYINPDDVEEFLKGMLESAFLYRWFLKGQQIRILPPGKPYYADVEKKELHIPANFAEYNWLHVHSRFVAFEKFIDIFRRFWWFWFSLGMIVIGDIELL